MDDDLIFAAAAAIREYLSTRPNAADTVEGIHQWWIRWDSQPESIAVTMAAVEHLAESGFLEPVKAGSRCLWRRRNDSGHASLPG